MTGDNGKDLELPGGRLRAQRERRGLTLPQAASELHVNARMLAALEADEYSELGAPIFVKGHLRNYARLLGLDPAELVADYEAAQQPADPTLVAHRPDGPRVDEHRQHAWVGWLSWVFLLLLAVLLAGWWWYQQEGGGQLALDEQPAERVPLPGAGQEPAPAGNDFTDAAAPGSGELSDRESADEMIAGQAPTASGQPETASTADEAPVAGTQETPPPPPPTPTSRQGGAATTGSTAVPAGRGLVLAFTEESWVEIYDAEGRPILYDLLAAGTRREINAGGELRVFLGNAEGVDVQVGGERFDLARHIRSDSTARFTVNVPAAE